jgi:hypothetical protein
MNPLSAPLPPIATIAPEQIVINPAAGPLIVNGETFKNETKPPIIAVKTPIEAGNPLAFAIPKLRGSASRKTKKPDMKSDLKCAFIPFRPSTGMDISFFISIFFKYRFLKLLS